MKTLSIPVSELPSKGYRYQTKTIQISSLTLKDLDDYYNYEANIDIDKLYKDLELIIKRKCKPKELIISDIPSILFAIRILSITDDEKYFSANITCDKCKREFNKKIDYTEIDFPDLDDNLKSIIGLIISGEQVGFQIPKLDHFIEVIKTLRNYHENISIKRAYLYSLFPEFIKEPNKIRKLIDNATLDEIILLNDIYESVICYPKPITVRCPNPDCKEEMAISLDDLFADLFRILRENARINTEKIIISKRVQDRHNELISTTT